MPVTAPDFLSLENALEDIGKAWILTGDPFTANGLSLLGLTPGDITPELNPDFINRVYEEYSSQPIAGSTKLRGYAPTVDIPLLWGDPAVYSKLYPTGAAAGGHTTLQAVVYTTLIIVPEAEFQSDWEYTAGAWVYPVGGPSHSVWIPKGYFSGAFPTFGSHNTENKNRVGSIPFTGELSDDAGWVEGTKAWVVGNPEDHGVTTLAI